MIPTHLSFIFTSGINCRMLFYKLWIPVFIQMPSDTFSKEKPLSCNKECDIHLIMSKIKKNINQNKCLPNYVIAWMTVRYNEFVKVEFVNRVMQTNK